MQRYQLLRCIGQGGFGEVFLAYDTKEKRKVALKRLKVPSKRKAFIQEAKKTAALDHPSIISIYSIHADEPVPYYTMPYVAGKTLKEVLVKRSVDSLIPIFIQICRAVSYAHGKGLIHRDLKPSNIIVGRGDKVVILDWGLVDTINKKQKHISGTISYIAPEVIFGKNPTVQSEVYTLGMLLYQMLTLRLAFHRSTVQEYAANFEKEVIFDPQVVAPERNIHPFYAFIALKALNHDPNKRYQTVDELLVDLESPLPDSSSPFYEAVRRLKRSPIGALEYFDSHHDPLRYLGRALFYESKKKYREEAECYSQAFRHYPTHPLVQLVKDRLLHRLKVGLNLELALVAARFLPEYNLKLQLEPLFFFHYESLENWPLQLQQKALAIQYAFWLFRPDVLEELIDELLQLMPAPLSLVENALFALIELGASKRAERILDCIMKRFVQVQAAREFELIRYAATQNVFFTRFKEDFLALFAKDLTTQNLQPLWHVLECALKKQRYDLIATAVQHFAESRLAPEQLLQLRCYEIWGFLLQKDVKACEKAFKALKATKDATSVSFLYGCYLGLKFGKKRALDYFLGLKNKSDAWTSFLSLVRGRNVGKNVGKNDYPWEKRRLYRRLSLFYSCIHEPNSARTYARKERAYYIK